MYSKVIQIYIYIYVYIYIYIYILFYILFHYGLSQVYTVLYGRSLLVIYLVYSSVCNLGNVFIVWLVTVKIYQKN